MRRCRTQQPGIDNPSDDGDETTQPCYICRGSYNTDTGENRVWCGKPDSGGWGMTQCETEEWDTDQFYCQTYENPCCVN